MDLRDQRAGGKRDDAAALCDAVRNRARSRPQTSEAEHILVVRVNIVWLFTCIRIDMPFIKPQRRNNAASGAFPGLSKISIARQGLDGDIEAAVSGEAPTHHHGFGSPVVGANRGNGLPRGRVEISREFPARGGECEFALDAERSGTDIAPAHP